MVSGYLTSGSFLAFMGCSHASLQLSYVTVMLMSPCPVVSSSKKTVRLVPYPTAYIACHVTRALTCVVVYRFRSRRDLSHKRVEQANAGTPSHIRDPTTLRQEHSVERPTIHASRRCFYLSTISYLDAGEAYFTPSSPWPMAACAAIRWITANAYSTFRGSQEPIVPHSLYHDVSAFVPFQILY
jgi:hypothetical protein